MAKKEIIESLEVGKKTSAVKGFFNEFKKFAIKGNVIDLAVGLIIGTAFNNIVQSIVKDIILPPIGFLTGRVDFSNMYINLSDKSFSSIVEAQAAGAPVIAYGNFINVLINFIIVAFVMFLLVKQINKQKDDAEEKPKLDMKDCPFCFSTINLQATRCPECTSELPKVSSKDLEKSKETPSNKVNNKKKK